MSYDEIRIPAGIPNVAGVDAPEGFTRNYVTIFKGYFCKYACDKEWDNFYEPDVLMNEELRNNARAVFNERTEEEFHNALYDNDADYARLVRYVIDCLVRQGLLQEERKEEGDTVYWRTDKMKALCPEILRVDLPVIDDLVKRFDTSPAEGRYDWTFSYKLSRPVYCKESVEGTAIKFEKDANNNLTGFKIIVENKTDSEATKIDKTKAEKLEKIITILSGIELKALPAGAEGIPKEPGLRRVYKDLVVKYDIGGSIDKIDITNSKIASIINEDVNRQLDDLSKAAELDDLSKAAAHKSHGRYSEAIKEAFRVIDEKPNANYYSRIVTDYNKYRCIRNILSHKEGESLDQGTKNDFTNYFKPIRDKFDFKYCGENNGRFIFDFDSPKTKKTLEQVAKDLIAAVRVILGL